MKKINIKVYIVTYKKNDVLNKNLESLFKNADDMSDVEVTVLANHPDVKIYNRRIKRKVRLVINNTRMANSWGYLSRDWNWAILDCYSTWENKEEIEWCVLAQNDVIWLKGWDSWLRREKFYKLVSQPRGDQCIALTIDAVKKIGFFDERFTTVHCQESDYFIRAIKRMGDYISINDDHELINMSHNPVGNVLIETSYSGVQEGEDQTIHNSINCQPSINLRNRKWERETFINNTLKTDSKDLSALEVNWYPFFWVGYKEIESTFLREYY